MKKSYHAHLLSSEYNHHVYTKTPAFALDCVHIKRYGRLLTCYNRLLLSELSCNASSGRSGVIFHKDRWTIMKMG